MADNQTVEQLQGLLTTKTNEAAELSRQLTAETTAHSTTRESLTAEKTAHAATKQTLATETNAHAATKTELVDANKFVDQLNEQLNAKTTGDPAEYIVTLGVASNARKFRVKLPRFNYKGKVYAREDVKSNSDLLKELVEKGVVVELVEAAK